MPTQTLPFACFFSGVTLPAPAPLSYILGTRQGGGRVPTGLNRVWRAGTCVRPGNSKISLLILSRLRVSDSVLRERLFGHETWGRIMARGSPQPQNRKSGLGISLSLSSLLPASHPLLHPHLEASPWLVRSEERTPQGPVQTQSCR